LWQRRAFDGRLGLVRLRLELAQMRPNDFCLFGRVRKLVCLSRGLKVRGNVFSRHSEITDRFIHDRAVWQRACAARAGVHDSIVRAANFLAGSCLPVSDVRSETV
jgi:hypothetical protein